MFVMTVTEKLTALKGINIGKLFDAILKDNEPEILKMAQDQMWDGVMDVNEPSKREKYAPSTIKAKRKAPYNKTDYITLKWTGKFHGELKLIIFKDKFVIGSDNLIWGNYLETQERFQSALGLTDDSKSELRNTVREDMIRAIKGRISKTSLVNVA